MIVFALTMLILVVMVLATLNLATRTKGRMEMQALADANAYTNAVATARALNGISIINRTMLSHWAAQAGGQALVSYATSRMSLNRALAASVAASNCTPSALGCCDPHDDAQAAALAALQANHDAYMANYDALDIAAESGVTNTQGSVGTLRRSAQKLIVDMEAQVAGPPAATGTDPDRNEMTTRLIQAANATGSGVGEIKWLDTQFVNRRETTDNFADRVPASTFNNIGEPGENPDFTNEALMGTGAIRYQPSYNFVMLAAAMGTRAGWTSSSGTPTGFTSQDLAACASAGFSCSGSSSGAGYWGDALHQHPGHAFVYADHDGTASASYTGGVAAPCSVSSGGARAANAQVRNTHLAASDGNHQWTGGSDFDDGTRHRQGPCGACPSVWVRTFSFAGAQPDETGVTDAVRDVYGQPKNYAALQKDLATVNDPWNRALGVRFPKTAASPTTFDLRVSSIPARLRNMYAIGTGIAYYHRAGDWQEAPNFLNPFWRATLTHGFIDNRSDSDLGLIFADSPEVSDAIVRLRSRGNVMMGASAP